MHTASTSLASTTSRQSPWARAMPNSLATRSLDSRLRLATDTSSMPGWALSLGMWCLRVLAPAPTNPTRIGLSVMGRHGNTVGKILPADPGATSAIRQTSMDTCCEVRPVPAGAARACCRPRSGSTPSCSCRERRRAGRQLDGAARRLGGHARRRHRLRLQPLRGRPGPGVAIAGRLPEGAGHGGLRPRDPRAGGAQADARSGPGVDTMGLVGLVALAANLVCLRLLWRHRGDDVNMRSAWICSRNDVIGNVSVLAAAAAVGSAARRGPTSSSDSWWPACSAARRSTCWPTPSRAARLAT